MRRTLIASALLVALCWASGYAQVHLINGLAVGDGGNNDTLFVIQGQGVAAAGNNLGRDTSKVYTTGGWTRGSVQYLFNDNDTGGAQDSVDARLVFGWSNDKANWTWLDSTAVRSTDSTYFYDTLVVRPFVYLRILVKPEIGNDSSGTTNCLIHLNAEGFK